MTGEALPEPVSDGNSGWHDSSSIDLTGLLVMVVFAVPILGGVLRSVLGRKLGAVATGAGVGLLAYLMGALVWMAVLGAAIALLYALMAGLGGGGRRGGSGGGWGGRRRRG